MSVTDLVTSICSIILAVIAISGQIRQTRKYDMLFRHHHKRLEKLEKNGD